MTTNKNKQFWADFSIKYHEMLATNIEIIEKANKKKHRLVESPTINKGNSYYYIRRSL